MRINQLYETKGFHFVPHVYLLIWFLSTNFLNFLYRNYLVKVVNRTRIPSTGHPVLPNGLKHHTLFYTLFESAVLTPVSLCFVYFATAFGDARVYPPVLYSPLEKSFASTRFAKQINRRYKKSEARNGGEETYLTKFSCS